MDDFLIYSGYLILLLNLILYSFSFFQREKANVFFVSYLFFSFLMQFSMELMYHLNSMNNLFVVNMFFVGQMILLGLFYVSILKNKKQEIVVISSMSLAIVIFIFLGIIDFSQFLEFNLLVITISSLLIVVYALLYFYNMLTRDKKYYYITVGIILYLLASTLLYLVGNLTESLSDDFKYFSWTLNAFLLLLYQFFILYEWKVSFSKKAIISK